MDLDLTELDAEALLDASTAAVRERRLAEVRDLRVLAQWAAVHSADPVAGPDGARAKRIGNVLVRLGGEGTSGVQDFCLGEIALARGTGVMATANAIADVLDLQHRLPATWAVCLAGEAEAAIVRANPGVHAERVEAERRRRFVGFGRTDETGLRTVVARVVAGDAVWVEATVTRVAEILAPRHPEAGRDEVLSIALGWLARPAELLALLLEHTDDTDDTGVREPEPDAGGPTTTRAMAVPADLLDALREADLSVLRPRTVIYLHLHQEAVLGGSSGAARVEGLGPWGLPQLVDLVGGTQVTVKPVIDLADRIRSTAYEHGDALKERVHLITGGDYWPFATSTNRRVDYDHPTPYDHDRDRDDGPRTDGGGIDPTDGRAPPAQSGTHNSGPLGRRHHRWKTHAGYRARQAGEGRYVWITPHGLGFLVDHRGTRRITNEEAETILGAPPGVDVYPCSRVVELGLG